MEEMEDEECVSCHAKDVYLTEYPYFQNKEGRERRLLCKLCANTPTGNAQEYPEQFQGQTAILKTVCFIGNEILKELRTGRVKS